MSTKIKNTLFRFVTMRTPELLEKEAIQQLFVIHPEQDKESSATFDSVFLQAANHIASGISRRKSLSNAATAFTPNALKTKEALYESNLISKEFYDFAIWLSKKRNSITLEEAIAKTIINNGGGIVGPMPRFTALDTTTLNTLWDNLLYQIVTYKSNYLREVILAVLVADFFVQNRPTVEQNNEEMQKLAQARIVIPKIVFEKENTAVQKTLLEEAKMMYKLGSDTLDKQLEIVLIQQQIEAHKKAVSEVKKAKKNYEKASEKAYQVAYKNHEDTIAGLYANANKVEKTIIDPISKQPITVTEYENLEIPTFTFEKEEELPNMVTYGKTSNDTNNLVALLVAQTDYETFDEVIEHLEQIIDQATEYVFQNSTLTETQITNNGVLLPVIEANTTPMFSIAGSSTSGSSSLELLFNNNLQQSDIVEASYAIVFDENGTPKKGKSYQVSNNNSQLGVTIFLEKVLLEDKNNFTITGELVRSNGTKISFSGYGSITETTIGLQKVIPAEGITLYNLRGNGKYTVESILEEDNQDLPDGITANGNVIDYIPSGFGIKRLGIADYRKVEQEVCCYVPGEVSHIENIMASEYKERATRSLQRREETNTSTTEIEKEKLTDTTTNNRFEMNKEISSLLAEDTQMGNTNTFSNHWGVNGRNSLSIGADFSTNTTKEESNSQALTQAKEVTERALDRIVQKVKEERVVKITNEFEETNKHGFDNTKGNNHVSGVYRWIDKVYRNKVLNYGKRLMYEFMIPQPASFQMQAMNLKATNDFEKIEKPIDPRYANADIQLKLDASFPERYKYWAALYNVATTTCPAKNISISKSLDISGTNEGGASKTENIQIPEGYVANKVTIQASGLTSLRGMPLITASIGNVSKGFSPSVYNVANWFTSNAYESSIAPCKNQISASVSSSFYTAATVSIALDCELTKEALEQWQLETFHKIIEAYDTKRNEYDTKISEAKNIQTEKLKTNPMFYRQIENMVLRKNCMEYLIGHQELGDTSLQLIQGNTLESIRVNADKPELETYTAKAKFLEQAFEWNLMSYQFYPFYWADKNNWANLYNLSEVNDPTFRAFLQSGMARVIVTIRPGFEEAVNWFIATGQVWNGGQVPTLEDPLYLSILAELKETTGEVEETWETRVPTSLTVIQAGSIGLDVQGLPCDDDCADYKLFDSDGQPVLDSNGQPISTNPIVQTNAVLNNNVSGNSIGTEGPNPDPYTGTNPVM